MAVSCHRAPHKISPDPGRAVAEGLRSGLGVRRRIHRCAPLPFRTRDGPLFSTTGMRMFFSLKKTGPTYGGRTKMQEDLCRNSHFPLDLRRRNSKQKLCFAGSSGKKDAWKIELRRCNSNKRSSRLAAQQFENFGKKADCRTNGGATVRDYSKKSASKFALRPHSSRRK